MAGTRTGERQAMPSMVFGVGFGRTGTASLAAALSKLGLKARHFLDYRSLLSAFDPVEKVFRADHVLPMLKDYRAIANGTGLPYRDLDRRFPSSKFILTVREAESWLRSKEREASLESAQWPQMDVATRAATRFVRVQIYGCLDFDRTIWLKAYQKHVDSVIEYFHDRPDDLLVLDIPGGDGWEKLCPFLQLPRPHEPFPATNDSASRAEWRHKSTRVLAQVAEHVPWDARFLLIDDGALYLDHPGALSFPERDGVYWGSPSDDATALVELDRAREAGATFAVIAWPSFWWLDHYRALAEHLRSKGRWLVDDDILKIVDLRPSGEHHGSS